MKYKKRIANYNHFIGNVYKFDYCWVMGGKVVNTLPIVFLLVLIIVG